VLALTINSQSLAGRDPRRYFDGKFSRLLDAALTAARCAGIFDDRALASTLSTSPSDCQEALLVSYLPPTGALRALVWLLAGFGPGPTASFANLYSRKLQRRLCAGFRLVEGDRQVIAQIRTARWSTAASSSTGGVSEPKDVAEPAKDVSNVGGVEVGASGSACDSGVTELVVPTALLGIGQNRVSLGGFFEVVLGFGIARIPIGVILEG
jgi:hypothetical protein